MAIHASFIAGTAYYPADLMQGWQDIVSNGVLSSSDLIVSQTSTPSMAVQVMGAPQGSPGGNCWINGYRIYNDTTTTLTIATANSTNPRIDLVVIGVDTSVNPYNPVLEVITGTPASSPTAPSIPGTLICLTLAQVYVAANASSITNSNITDKRIYSHINNSMIPLSSVFGYIYMFS